MYLFNLFYVTVATAAVSTSALPAQKRSVDSTLHAILSDGSTRELDIKSTDKLPATLNASFYPQTDPSKPLDANFLNFDPSIATDIQHKAQLVQAWKDGIKLVSVTFNDGQYGRPPFSDYFALSDGQSVKDTFYNVYDGDENIGSQHLRAQIFDNDDYAAQCIKPEADNSGPVVVAYTANSVVDGRSMVRTHFCKNGYSLPALKAVTCNSLGNTVSNKMNILGGILLQQWMHLNTISIGTIGQHIGDIPNGYGPSDVRELFPNDQRKNAANYRWFALETYWSVACGKKFSDPRFRTDAKEDL